MKQKSKEIGSIEQMARHRKWVENKRIADLRKRGFTVKRITVSNVTGESKLSELYSVKLKDFWWNYIGRPAFTKWLKRVKWVSSCCGAPVRYKATARCDGFICRVCNSWTERKHV